MPTSCLPTVALLNHRALYFARLLQSSRNTGIIHVYVLHLRKLLGASSILASSRDPMNPCTICTEERHHRQKHSQNDVQEHQIN